MYLCRIIHNRHLMKPFRLALLLFLSVVLCRNLSAQNESISGRDFWVNLPYDYNDTVTFYAIGDTATFGTIDNEHYNYHLDFQIVPGQVTLVRIPASLLVFDALPQCYNVSFRGVRIRSSNNIFLYMQNRCTIPDSSIVLNANNLYMPWGNGCTYCYTN